MEADKLLDFLTGAAKDYLTSPDATFTPMLTTEDAEGHLNIIGLVIDGHPYDAVRMVAPKMRDEQSPVRVTLSVDSYAFKSQPGDTMPMQSPSELFAAGDPRVTEAIIIHIVTPGEASVVTLPYRRTETSIEWDEPWSDGDGDMKVTGRMVEALRGCLL